ncbi:MAG: hypothetical protein JW987_05960 [Anaerolineaceae bacterium]|nr:hypothetical protein [Anaerolineaceae bacterium]
MKLQKPKQATFWIAVVLAVLGMLGQFASVSALAPYAFWLVLAAFVLLVLGVLLDGI